MAEPGDPERTETPAHATVDPDDLVGFASPASLAARVRVSEPRPESSSTPSPLADRGPVTTEAGEPGPVERPPVGPALAEPGPIEPGPTELAPVEDEPDLFDPPARRDRPGFLDGSATGPVTDSNAAPPPAWARETPAPDPRRKAAEPPQASLGLYAVYALILFAVPTLGASALIALLAVTGREPPEEPVARSHFIFQQRTLWAGAVAAVAGAILVVVNLGVFILFLLALWLIARGGLGVLRLKAGRPLDNPRTWLI